MQVRLTRLLAIAVVVVAAQAVTASSAFGWGAGDPYHFPAGGDACNSPTGQANEGGKITGRGATFQDFAQTNDFIPNYREEVCGDGRRPAGGAADLAQWYNSWTTLANNGSGAGLDSLACKTNAYAGSDIPYTEAQLQELDDSTPGPLTGRSCPADTFIPPYQPKGNDVSPRWPAPGSNGNKVINFPVALGAVAVGFRFFNLDTQCGNPGPAQLQLTEPILNALFGGDILQWNDPRLRIGPNGTSINPQLATCTDAAKVIRVVRNDNSGTTTNFKSYITKFTGGNRAAGATCQPGVSWTSINGQNPTWPSDGAQTVQPDGIDFAATANCSALIRKNASDGVTGYCRNNQNTICYADIADANTAPNLKQAQLRNRGDTSWVTPLTRNFHSGLTTQANCDVTFIPPGLGTTPTPPGGNNGTDDQAVGLDLNDNWGTDNVPNHGDTTYLGGKWPICALTYMLFYSGMTGNGDSTYTAGETPIDQLSGDQRQNLYSYALNVASVSAQERLRRVFYAPIPLGWLQHIVEGIKKNF